MHLELKDYGYKNKFVSINFLTYDFLRHIIEKKMVVNNDLSNHFKVYFDKKKSIIKYKCMFRKFPKCNPLYQTFKNEKGILQVNLLFHGKYSNISFWCFFLSFCNYGINFLIYHIFFIYQKYKLCKFYA